MGEDDQLGAVRAPRFVLARWMWVRTVSGLRNSPAVISVLDRAAVARAITSRQRAGRAAPFPESAVSAPGSGVARKRVMSERVAAGDISASPEATVRMPAGERVGSGALAEEAARADGQCPGHVDHREPGRHDDDAAATIAQYLAQETPVGSDDPDLQARWEQSRADYLALLDKEDWCDTARKELEAQDGRLTWLADSVAPQLKLRAFLNDRPSANDQPGARE